MKDVFKKILIGVGVVIVLTIGGLGLTAFIDNRIEAKTTDPIEELTNKVDTIDIKVDNMSDNVNSILYILCKDSITDIEIEKMKENNLIK